MAKMQVNVRLEPGLVAALDRLAAGRGWTRSQWVEAALRRVVGEGPVEAGVVTSEVREASVPVSLARREVREACEHPKGREQVRRYGVVCGGCGLLLRAKG